MARAAFSASDFKRAVKLAEAVGKCVQAVEIGTDGAIRLEFATAQDEPKDGANGWNRVLRRA